MMLQSLGPCVQVQWLEPRVIEWALIFSERQLKSLLFLFFFSFDLKLFSSRLKQVAPLARVNIKRAKMAWVQWLLPVFPVTQEAQEGGLLGARRERPAWAIY